MTKSNIKLPTYCFINIGTGVYQEHILKSLKKKGIFTISTDILPNVKGLRYADAKIICSSHNYKQIFLEVLRIKKQKKLKVIGVISGCTRGAIYTASYLSKKFDLECLNLKTAKLISNKRLFLKKNNKKIFIKKSKLKYLRNNNFPIVLKDDRFSGAAGVSLIHNKNELLKIELNKKYYTIEKYIKAKHIIVTGLIINSKVSFSEIIEKKINKNFTTSKLIYPSSLNELEKDKINHYVKNKLNLINFNYGPFSYEIFFTDKEIYSAEIEPSIPGSFINEYILKKCLNINLVELIINNIQKLKININNKILNSIKIEFYYTKNFIKSKFERKNNSTYKIIYKKINNQDLKNKKKCLYTLIYIKKYDKNL
jgi:hypothetical protein